MKKIHPTFLCSLNPSSCNKTAIVFVHGLLGFSSLSILGKDVQYFRSLLPYLHKHLLSAYFPALPSVAHIEDRARALANFISAINADQIDLIAHSMGGLDSRYAIQHFDPQHRIRSLTTIATPHHGTLLAQWIIEGKVPFSALLRRITLPALHDLTPDSCAQFNQEINNQAHVKYRSYAARRPPNEMPLIFRPWTQAIAASNGDNDSQIPVSSAQWGEFKGTLRADHVELIGWSLSRHNVNNARPFNHLHFYSNLVQELTAS